MYEKTPKIKNTAGKIYALAFLICGAFMFIAPMIWELAFGVFIQLSGIVMITVSVYIATAFLLRNYTFSIAPGEQRTVDVYGIEYENPIQRIDFTVYDNRPRRSILVCRIGLDEIERVEIIERKNYSKFMKSVRDKNRYKYDATYNPKKLIAVLTAGDCVLVTFDEELYRALTSKNH